MKKDPIVNILPVLIFHNLSYIFAGLLKTCIGLFFLVCCLWFHSSFTSSDWLKKSYRCRTECPLGKIGDFKPHSSGWDPAPAERLPLRWLMANGLLSPLQTLCDLFYWSNIVPSSAYTLLWHFPSMLKTTNHDWLTPSGVLQPQPLHTLLHFKLYSKREEKSLPEKCH